MVRAFNSLAHAAQYYAMHCPPGGTLLSAGQSYLIWLSLLKDDLYLQGTCNTLLLPQEHDDPRGLRA